MGTISDLVAELAEAGATAEIIKIAVRAVESRDMQIEARRSADRERKRRQREGLKKEVHGNVTGHSEEIPQTIHGNSEDDFRAYKDNHARADGNPCSTSLRSVEIITPLPTEGPQGGRSRSRGTALPDDWTPSAALFAYAAEQGLSRLQAESTFEDMRIWAVANRNRPIARKADWDLTAKGFIRRDAKKARAGPAHKPRTWLAALAANTLNLETGNEPQNRPDVAGEKRFDCQNVLALSVTSRQGAGGNGDDDFGLSGDDAGVSFGGFLKRM